MKTLIAVIMVFALVVNSKSEDSKFYVYNGEPFGEALYDVLVRGGAPISHQLVKASPLSRSDAFRLRDGRILILSSTARKLGELYLVQDIKFLPATPKNRSEQ